jgi:hypothetical protein
MLELIDNIFILFYFIHSHLVLSDGLLHAIESIVIGLGSN